MPYAINAQGRTPETTTIGRSDGAILDIIFLFSKLCSLASLAESEKSLETFAGSKFIATFVNESLWIVSRWRGNTNYKVAINSADIGVSIRSNCE